MIVDSKLCEELFRSFYIQRWNDRIRPMELIEADKHAHKMLLAWAIGKYEERRGNTVDWDMIIRNGIFELLRRIVISDIKSPIYSKIKKQKHVFESLNKYVYSKLQTRISNPGLLSEIEEFLHTETDETSLSQRVSDAAHIYASYWEFQIIRNSNPHIYQNMKIETELADRINEYKDMDGIQRIMNLHTISSFVDLFGQLRFQVRWAQLPRIPKTSVLGHSMLVACLAYFFARENNAGPKRLYNAFFGGLFHDLPEAATRDIISPVKNSSHELESLLADIELDLAEKEILPLVEPEWRDELKLFTVNEFSNKINGKADSSITTDDINSKYDDDKFNAYDGVLVRDADHLSAFTEVWSSCNSGIKTEELCSAANHLKGKYKGVVHGNTDMEKVYDSFSTKCFL